MKARHPANTLANSSQSTAQLGTPPADTKPNLNSESSAGSINQLSATLSCQTEIPPMDGLQDNQLTVGREFYIHCKGTWPKEFDLEKAQFVWSQPNQKYILKLLSAQLRSVDEADLKVTSYMAAKVQIPNLILADGTHQMALGPVSFDVASVLDPKTPQPKPYGPIGPISILWPLAYTLFFSFIATVLATYIFRFFWQKRRERELRQKLRELETPLLPEAQFFKDYRALKRESQIFYGEFTSADILDARDRIERMLRVFISREFGVLATEWTSQRTLRQLRGNKRWQQLLTPEVESELARLLVELERSRKDQDRLHRADVLQYASWSQGVIEKLALKIPEEKMR